MDLPGCSSLGEEENGSRTSVAVCRSAGGPCPGFESEMLLLLAELQPVLLPSESKCFAPSFSLSHGAPAHTVLYSTVLCFYCTERVLRAKSTAQPNPTQLNATQPTLGPYSSAWHMAQLSSNACAYCAVYERNMVRLSCLIGRCACVCVCDFVCGSDQLCEPTQRAYCIGGTGSGRRARLRRLVP